jgi:rhamnose transport system permease protein
MKRALVAVLVAEVGLFAVVAPNFISATNLFEVVRISVELGLIALALTPVLVTGGIDLSVGALLGLSAVVFGMAFHDWNLSTQAATAVALLTGLMGGSLNGLLIARWSAPPLIVTLGTLSLFRGIAEGLTEGAISYSGFPPRFLALGQAYLWGLVPRQVLVLVPAAIVFYVLLHRSVVGRAWYAIGLSVGGARYAGIPVVRRVSLAYALSGLMSGLAGVVYVAHLGQARADAGSGYELDAITAVVLGGTSAFGGTGSIGGTMLGLFALAILKNGLSLAAWPSEAIGILTGAMLVATIALDRIRRTAHAAKQTRQGELDVRNSQVAAICAAVIGGSVLVAATNVWLVRELTTPGTATAAAAATPSNPEKVVIAVMPKAKGDPYFVSCRAGAEEAARELGVELIWDGPTSLDAARQNEFVESWRTRGVSAIAVAVENRAAISTVLRKAREQGIKVLTWDADAEADARDFFVNQATAEGIGEALTDEAAQLLGGKGEFAVITGALTAANQNAWIASIRKRLAQAHPGLRLALIRPSDDDRDKAFLETQTIMRVAPQVRLVMAISAPAVPGAAEAVRQAGRSGDVKVIGLSLPNINKPYVHDGTVQTVVLWNTADLGYLTVRAAAQLVRGAIAPTQTWMDGGRLGRIEIRGGEIILGPPLRFTKKNIDQFDF